MSKILELQKNEEQICNIFYMKIDVFTQKFERIYSWKSKVERNLAFKVHFNICFFPAIAGRFVLGLKQV
jgi:hypothetical protein